MVILEGKFLRFVIISPYVFSALAFSAAVAAAEPEFIVSGSGVTGER